MKKILLAAIAACSVLSCKNNETSATTATTTGTETTMGTDSAVTSVAMPDSVNTSSSAANAAGEPADLSAQDKDFAEKAAIGGMLEVKLGNLAQSKGTSAKVKDLGKMMVADHTKANDKLKSIAAKSKITLPTDLSAEKQNDYDMLNSKSGAEFDKAYADFMVKDHKKDIGEFTKQSSNGKHTALKNFATETLPTLEHHLMTAEETQKAVK